MALAKNKTIDGRTSSMNLRTTFCVVIGLSLALQCVDGFHRHSRTRAPTTFRARATSRHALAQPKSFPADPRPSLHSRGNDSTNHPMENPSSSLVMRENDAASVDSTEASLVGLLVSAIFHTLSRPSVVSLPGGVLLAFVLLPFFSSLPQMLTTIGLFTWFGRLRRKVFTSESSLKRGSKNVASPFWDSISLGLAAEIAHFLWPRHEIAQSTAQHHGWNMLDPLLPLVGFMAVTLAVLFFGVPAASQSTASNRVESTKASSTPFPSPSVSPPVEPWETIYDQQQVQQLNTWDQAMVSRETNKGSNGSNVVVLPRPTSPGQKGVTRRDCYVPAGPIGIFMISTERGPAIHTVKEECGLASYVAPGDLIVELDGVDTQSCTAQEVMEMMMNRREYTRKLTVVSTEDPR